MNWIPLVILGIVTLLLALVIGELGIRWWFRRQGHYYVWPPYLRLELQPDRDVYPELERVARIEINRDGERGGDPLASHDGLYRILVAGGSPVECALLDQPTSWPGALEQLLQKPEHLQILGASRVHVGNIGRSGIAAAHLDCVFERILPRYRHLDAILIMVGGNDVSHWLMKGAPASYRPSPILTSAVFGCHPDGPFGCKARSTAAAELMRRLQRRLLRPVKVRNRSGAWVGTARAMRANAKEVRHSVGDPAEMLDNFERHLRRVIEMAKDKADRVLVIRQPWFQKNYTEEEISHFWHGGTGDPFEGENVTVYYSLEIVSGLMELLDARAERVAKECDVENLNLRPLLEPSLRTFYDFLHVTPSGAAEVAFILCKTLLHSHRNEEGARILSQASAFRQ